MDELKLVLSSRLMRGIVTKIIKKAIFKKTGYEIDIQINKISAEVNEGKVSVNLDVDAEMNSEDLLTIVKNGGLM